MDYEQEIQEQKSQKTIGKQSEFLSFNAVKSSYLETSLFLCFASLELIHYLKKKK